MPNSMQRSAAQEHYARSVSKAQMADLLRLIRGQQASAANFEEVSRRLRTRQQVGRRMEVVPLDKIVGSVGRYQDFTKEFLPRRSASQERWTKLDAALNALEHLPPVELYKIGDVYFVKDGNHRVSVARANGLDFIEAHVTELEPPPVPLTSDDFQRDQWIVKAEYADFLKDTQLDKIRPGADLLLTVPGRYDILRRHIDVHGYLRNQELAREGKPHRLSREQVVASWYDNVYMPVVEAIRKYGLLKHFPKRTEADLYLWIAQHREALARRFGLAPLDPETSVRTFAETHSERPLERTLKGLKLGLHRAKGNERPLGMSAEEFEDARNRHDAGEIALSEAEMRQGSKESPQERPEESPENSPEE